MIDTNSTNVVAISNVTRKYGVKLALDNVSLNIPKGSVFGLIGGNGAGKTTIIRHILGLLKPHSGSVQVFGLDPVADPVNVLGRIGYLSEDRDLPSWMRVFELLRYTQAFYPLWDEKYAETLRDMFELEPTSRIRDLSRGQLARAGLLIALAHRPELLVLDEPSSGLDPIVRRDILGAIIRTVAEEGRTVLFSSHLLDEVERVADQVAIIHQGKIALSGPLDEMKQNHCKLTLRFNKPLPQPPSIEGTLTREGAGAEWTIVCEGNPNPIKLRSEALGATVVDESLLTLDEIFVARVSATQTLSN